MSHSHRFSPAFFLAAALPIAVAHLGTSQVTPESQWGALGADQHTLAGLAGMGDLVATCSSPLSRNRTFGENLGRGMPLAEAAASASQVTEGVKSAGPVLELARAHGATLALVKGRVETSGPILLRSGFAAYREERCYWLPVV